MSTGVSMVADVLHVKSSMSTGVSTVADVLRVRFNATITCIILVGELHAAQVESGVSPDHTLWSCIRQYRHQKGLVFQVIFRYAYRVADPYHILARHGIRVKDAFFY